LVGQNLKKLANDGHNFYQEVSKFRGCETLGKTHLKLSVIRADVDVSGCLFVTKSFSLVLVSCTRSHVL